MTAAYKAFITYSHEDSRFASRLQKKLEAYKVPPRLVGKDTARGEVPARLRPVFRDREELSAGSSLQASVSESLENSEFLIVVCSPASARSEWVNREIADYRRMHGSEQIICVIADGEPYASIKTGDKDRECFPPALGLTGDHDGTVVPSEFEHVAADARSVGDGPRGALLKIIAGMIGVRLDELVQRDAQRRSRIWAGVAAASAVLAAAMLALALVAIDARQEADLRRAQAENLIGFMLGDLRKGLKPIGRLDLLDAVGDEAMNYFEALDDEATPTDLFSRAMALRQIGEVRFGQGQLQPALDSFIESHDVLQRLVDLDQTIDDYLFELGQSEFWVGYVHYERDEFGKALDAMNRYMTISRELVTRQPDNQGYLAELAYAWSNLGSVARMSGNMTDAIGYFRESAEINERQLAEDPGNASLMDDLAGGYSWIGTAEQELGNLDASEEAFRLAYANYDELASVEDNARYRERRAETAGLLSSLLVQREKYDEAYTLARLNYDEFAQLVAHDPTNNRWKRQYAVAATNVAEAAHMTGRSELVDSLLTQARRQIEELIAIDPSNEEWQARLEKVDELAERLQASP